MSIVRVITIVLTLSCGVALADFVPEDEVVSDPASDLPQPEFDEVSSRMIWQYATQLWVAHVDPATGALNPTNGRGQLVDTGLVPAGEAHNTPRYAFGRDQSALAHDLSALVYTKVEDGLYQLARAREVEPNTWEVSLLENGLDRWKPNGTPPENLGLPRIVYNRDTIVGPRLAWRVLDDAASEQTVNVVAAGGRFLGTEPSILVLNHDGSDVVQVYEIPLITGTPVQITSGPEEKINPFVWWAPEYQDYLFVVMLDYKQLAVYRRIDGMWTETYRYTIPDAKPLYSSPEGFSVNGRSYIAVIACNKLGNGGFVGQPVGPSEVWVTGIDPAQPFFRRVDDPSYRAQRSEPEPFTLRGETIIYYSEHNLQNDILMVKRAKTGLAEATGYDLSSYGGSWSSAARDNTNCACAPQSIADRYAPAYEVAGASTQIAHPTLGPEGQLYYTMRSDADQKSYLVAVDSHVGFERYRIDERSATPRLDASAILISSTGQYYVPADGSLLKFAANGSLIWKARTNGLARGAQFLPDGNIVFFTWNGWAYIVSPDGVPLFEKNLTPSRTYSPDASCLTDAPLGHDCAYVGAPAVDGTTRKVFITQIRADGNSTLQGFRYRTSPSIALESLWGSHSPVLPGIATTPVLSRDYTRLYVQDGGGALSAFDAENGTSIWSLPLGFASDEGPSVSDDGYIMPGGTADGDPRANFVGIVQDFGAGARWVLQDSAYVPASSSAAGSPHRFALVGRDAVTRQLQVIVAAPGGIVSATPLGGSFVPSAVKAITVRDDGWLFLQTVGIDSVRAFAPSP